MASYNYYEILGVPSDASAELIRSKYRALVQRVHPDGGGTAGVFDYVQRAYDTLSDPEKRRLYDSTIARGENADDDLDDEDEENSRDERPEDHEENHDTGGAHWDASSGQASYTYLRGRGFELFLVHAFRDAGMQVRHTPELVGIDLSVTRPEGRVVIQATGSSYPIGPDIIGEIDWAREYYGAESAMVITNSVFSPGAKQHADQLGVRLWDGEQLGKFLQSGTWPGWDYRESRKRPQHSQSEKQPSSQVQSLMDTVRRHPVFSIVAGISVIALVGRSLVAVFVVVIWCSIIFGVRKIIRKGWTRNR